MRTTLNVDDDVLETAKSIAHTRRVSVGEALSDLARRGMNHPVEITTDPVTGLPLIRSGRGTVTSEEIYRLQAEEDVDYALELMRKR